MKCKVLMIFAVSAFVMLTVLPASWAGETKIATISLQDVLADSKAGQAAQKVLQAEVKRFQKKFAKEQEELESLRSEIEKKSSVWSDDIRTEKARDYEKKMREFKLKTEDAQFELKQLEKKKMEPMLKALHEIIAELGKNQQYTLILENTRKGLSSRNGLLYASEKVDISDEVKNILDEKYKK